MTRVVFFQIYQRHRKMFVYVLQSTVVMALSGVAVVIVLVIMMEIVKIEGRGYVFVIGCL